MSDSLQLPVFHPSALKLRELLATDEFHVNQVAAVIMEDPSLSSHVLHVANSSFFAGLSQITTIPDAVKRLGSRQIADIVMMVTQKAAYQAQSPMIKHYSDPLWQHAIGCALGSKWLAEQVGHRQYCQEAFLAGLLHDVGHLLLLKVLDEIVTSGKYRVDLTKAVISDVFESLHATYGAKLLAHWNFPELYQVVARDHHLAEDYDVNNPILGMVRLVNLALHKLGVGLVHDESIILAATLEVYHLDVSEVVIAELEIAIEDALRLPV